MEEASDGFRVMQQIFEAKESLTTIRLFFITDGVVRSLELDEEQFPGIEVRYVVWDLDKLRRLCWMWCLCLMASAYPAQIRSGTLRATVCGGTPQPL
jgi:ABC-type arginine/histidine transport system permease subunit